MQLSTSLNLLIKVTSSMVVLLSILIISLWAIYQTAEVTFGGPPSSGEPREVKRAEPTEGEGGGLKSSPGPQD